MKRLIITFICLFGCLIGFAQLPPEIKHIEIISEPTDTMALLNKSDLDKINTTFYRVECLDSLNRVNEQIIVTLNVETVKLRDIISEQRVIIDNKDRQIENIKEQNKDVISDLEKQVKKANGAKTFWMSTTGIGIIAVIFLAIF